MKIKNLKIANWRSIKELNISANDLMIIIGQNNHGKSNLLSSVLFFFGEVKAQDLDFNFGTSELYVEVTFSDLDSRDKSTFQKYVTSDNTIVVRKTAYLGGNFEYKGYIENPVDDYLQEAKASLYTSRELAMSLPFGSLLPSSGKLSKQSIIDAQKEFIERNRNSLEFRFEQEETNFLGLKNVAKGIFGEVYFVPAVKEVSDDFTVKETSAFGKIYSEVISHIASSDTEWMETKNRIGKLFAALNKIDGDGNHNVARPNQLIEFENALSEELRSWGAEVSIEVSAPDIESVFKANTEVWINDGIRTDIRRKGHGLQRALTIALIHVIAARVSLISDENESTGRSASNSRYYIFEEPELYLHPQAQRELFDSLVRLSSANQVLLCTHSSALVDVEKYKSIYIVSKENDSAGSRVKYCSDELFAGDSKKDFNLTYWINPDRSELFFATKVLLVEGATEKTVIPLLAKKLNVFRYDYTLIDCGSKTSIPQYIKLLNSFCIPYTAIYDRDHQSTKGLQAINAADNVSRCIEDAVIQEFGSTIILDNDIEEELGIVNSDDKNKPYIALNYISSEDFVISDSLRAKIISAYS